MSSSPQHSQKEPLPPDTVREHVYDGIEEYDNCMPNWWLWTFYLAIIFSFLYWFFFFETTVAQTDAERVGAALTRIEEARLAQVGELNSAVLWQMSQNASFVEAGRQIFMGEGTCHSCHGANLQGGIGVNLADQQWVWGNTPMSVYQVISEGSPDPTKGMVAWKRLGPDKVKQVTAFILSHHNPAEMAGAETINPPIGRD